MASLKSCSAVERATPEYILECIRVDFCWLDEVNFDDTMENLQCASDLYTWRKLATALGKEFDVTLSPDEWRHLLKPAKKKTLRDLCNALAAHVSCERIQPIKVLGTTCMSASVFLKIRERLAQAGADVSALRPDTPLEGYLLAFPTLFTELRKQFPGRFDGVYVTYAAEAKWIPFFVFLVVVPFSLGSAFLIPQDSWWDFVGHIVGSVLVAWLANVAWMYILNMFGYHPKPTSARINGMKTFRDLINALVEPPAFTQA